MSEKTHSPLPWRLFTDEAGQKGILDANENWVAVNRRNEVRIVSAEDMAFVVECVNRRVPLPDAELEAIRERAARCSILGDARLDVERLLAENERLLGLLDDLFRDHGANADETPTVQIREENARLREALRRVLDVASELHGTGTTTGDVWELGDRLEGIVREALGVKT